MKVLVTGASGFLGHHLLPRLAAAGHEVIAVSRRRPGQIGGATHLSADVTVPGALDAALVGVDAVIHAAGRVSHRPEDASALWDLHVTGTERVLDAARAAGVRRVVYLSTSGTVAVSDKRGKLPTESSPTPMQLIARWPYYRSKLSAERSALAFNAAARADRPAFEIISLNPSLLLGPGDVDGSSTGAVKLWLEDKVMAAPPGSLSFCDARDVAAVCERALTAGRPGERYLLGAANWTFADFYGRLARLTDREPLRMRAPALLGRALGWLPELGKDGFGGGPDRYELELACQHWGLDDNKARRELGWAPRDPMSTLADTVDDVTMAVVGGR